MSEIQSGHEGERYLQMLGLEHLAESPVSTPNGTIQAKDFLQICGDHARPILVGFESMSKTDPRYETTRNVLRSLIGQYIERR